MGRLSSPKWRLLQAKLNVLSTVDSLRTDCGPNAGKMLKETTSLLEGSVKIIKGNSTSLLNPGQQAVWNEREEKVSINNADMDEAVAWKNGLFQFDGANIVTIMREIGRWYNVKVEYEGEIPSRKFEGKISRSAELSEVLKILELSNIKFTLVGNKIIVH